MGKEATCNAGDTGDAGSIPGLGRSPGGENGNPLQYSCLKNSKNRGAWWVIVHVVTMNQTRLSDYYFDALQMSILTEHDEMEHPWLLPEFRWKLFNLFLLCIMKT